MRKIPSLLILSMWFGISVTTAAQNGPDWKHVRFTSEVVPLPKYARVVPSAYYLSSPVIIAADVGNARVAEIAEFLAGAVRERTEFEVHIVGEDSAEFSIRLATNLQSDNLDAYELESPASGISINGASPEGLLWGVQSLLQLFPPTIAASSDTHQITTWILPHVEIHDEPRFPWRGSLMDVSRHFFSVEFVKRYIDLLSQFKMNVLHWHLTEDQAWRLEIDQYPRLTEVGAWRTEPDGSRYGGFYTKDEVREIIEYARVRGVMVVPEIEMPGHATAALVAYPELACSDPPTEVPNDWGVFPDIYCAGKPETFTFLENVLDEVAELFPSPYIHIGGDEVPKDRWCDCEPCQEIIERAGLGDEDGLQAWFIQRIGEHLASRGKTLIGWDEILDGGGVPGSVVQVWRNQETVREAIRQGHDVIVSPTSHAYFDYSPAALSLEQVYSFDPAQGLSEEEAQHVLGGEANLWSEYITEANFDLQAFPRLLAMAEVLWSGGGNFANFKSRLESDTYPRLRAMGVGIGPEDSDVVRLNVGTDEATGQPRVHVETSVEGLEVRYTTDSTPATVSSLLVTDSTSFAEGDQIVLGVFANEEPLPIRREFAVIGHLARGKPITFEFPPDSRYPGPSPNALTDGLLASTDHRDGLSQGWWDNDMVATIDLGGITSIESVSSSFYTNLGSWIAPPSNLELEFSRDGQHWENGNGRVRMRSHDLDGVPNSPIALWISQGEFDARYIRLTAFQSALPDSHPGAGHAAWLFADEIIVR